MLGSPLAGPMLGSWEPSNHERAAKRALDAPLRTSRHRAGPAKALMELINELNRILEEKERRLKRTPEWKDKG
jgi:hypothetical protein